MNMIVCGECCRWQKDGLCTLTDLSRGVSGKSADCRYFEKSEEQQNDRPSV